MIDSHCHLTDERIDAASVIGSMEDSGLKALITVGYDMTSSERGVELARLNRGVYAAVGLHPSELAGAGDDDLERLLALTRDEKTVAVGEIGLDYYYEGDREEQKRWLCRQLELTSASKLPAVFHVRDAYGDMEKIIAANLDKLPARGVMHCFSGSLETALHYVDMGFYISFSGSITFKNAYKFSEIIRALPEDRILAETDSPYLTPVPHRGKPNNPAYVRLVVAKIAECRGGDFERTEKATENNARTLFAKMR